MFILSKFVERLEEFMILKGLNATKLSAETGIDRSTISGLLRGEGVPAAKTLFALVDYFNCSADYLLGLTDDYPQNKIYPPVTDNFGARFRYVLKNTNTSQYSLTKKKNISGNLIYKWLQNQTLPNATNLIKLAEFMEVSVDHLIGREN